MSDMLVDLGLDEEAEEEVASETVVMGWFALVVVCTHTTMSGRGGKRGGEGQPTRLWDCSAQSTLNSFEPSDQWRCSTVGIVLTSGIGWEGLAIGGEVVGGDLAQGWGWGSIAGR